MRENLSCACGKVRGLAAPHTKSEVNRAVCHCASCQAAAHALGRGDLLDFAGGSDIVQVPLGRFEITEGAEHIRLMRLTPKGLYRWYAACCNTPMANTMSPGWPFVGISAGFFSDPAGPEHLQPGPLRRIQLKSATARVPVDEVAPKSSLMSLLVKIMGWRLRGLNKPNPFFTEGGKPVAVAWIVSEDPTRP